MHGVIEQRTLDNGMKILCLKKASAPIVSVQIWYKTGSVNERDGIRGISHFFEHMMFRGSKNFKPEEHAKRINEAGGHCNAFTAEDVTAYLNSVPKTNLEMVFELEADRMRNLAITAETLETERKVIVEEYHTYMNNPVAKAFLEFRKELFGPHPYAVSPLGVLEDINRITVQDCKEYYSTWYAPSNALMVVVGDFDSADQVLDLAQKRFGPISASGPAPAQGPMPPAVQRSAASDGFMRRRVEFDVPILLVGFAAPPACHKDALSLDILQQIASHGETSRLHREMVRRQSVAVMAGGMNLLMKHAGMSLFFAAFTPDVSPRRVEAAINAQISRMRDSGITEPEMQKVKNSTLSNRVFEMYSADSVCQRIGFAETVEGDYRQWSGRLAALENLDIGQLSNVARTHWDESRRSVLYLKPLKTKPLLFLMGLVRRLSTRRAKAGS